MGGVSTCCSTRDRHDKLDNIEQNNDKQFYFNYPKMIADVETKINSFRE